MREFFSVIWMACKDLRHDARMTVCLVLTVAAIALPLLLFFGLKNGVVEVMRQRMINDPSYMEVIPQGTSTFDSAWFETWRNNAHVGFVVPKTRELGVGGSFSNPAQSDKMVRADMQPTGAGDWLLQSYRVQIPDNDACVLTASLAQKLQISSSDSIEITISRQKKGGGIEKASRKFVVSGILPQQASGRDLAFIPLEQLEHMEAFRDGFSVESFGWPGEKPLAYPVFYGGVLYTRESLSPIAIAQLRQRTGFVRLQENVVQTKEGWHSLQLEAGNSPVSLFKLQELRNVLRGQEWAFVPMAGPVDAPLELILQGPQGQGTKLSLQVHASSLWPTEAWQGISPTDAAWSAVTWHDVQKVPALLLLSPQDAEKLSENKAIATFKAQDEESLTLPLHVLPHADIPVGQAVVAPGLVARLNLLYSRPLETLAIKAEDRDEVQILLGRQNYSRFRMYARSLDDVAPLAAQLEAANVIVKTRMADIERVRSMDRYLTLILGLIASAAVLGGVICLLASLYASVERKRRALAVLRLLGIHGSNLCAFPLTAGIVMTGLGMLLSLLLFHVLAFYMNMLAQDFILPGEVLCRLQWQQQLWAVLLALLASVLAGLAAAARLLKIEASESLRDE